nr:MAG TPA: hypothetical protein [Caudoviricetes sp.]
MYAGSNIILNLFFDCCGFWRYNKQKCKPRGNKIAHRKYKRKPTYIQNSYA